MLKCNRRDINRVLWEKERGAGGTGGKGQEGFREEVAAALGFMLWCEFVR